MDRTAGLRVVADLWRLASKSPFARLSSHCILVQVLSRVGILLQNPCFCLLWVENALFTGAGISAESLVPQRFVHQRELKPERVPVNSPDSRGNARAACSGCRQLGKRIFVQNEPNFVQGNQGSCKTC